MKKYIYTILLLIFLSFSCTKDNLLDEPKENVVDSPFQVKYEIITDNNVYHVSNGGNTFHVTYNIEINGVLYGGKFESWSTTNVFPTIWTKEFTATMTNRPYTLSLSATIPLQLSGKQYFTGNIYVNGNIVATQKSKQVTTLGPPYDQFEINFGWAAQKP